MANVTFINQRRSQLTPARTSMAHMSKPTKLATITNSGVLTIPLAVNVTLPCHVTGFHAKPALCMGATTNQIEDG